MASNADGRISGLQHSRATAPYEGRLGYVFKKSRMEICQDAGKAVPVYETARLYWEWSVHKELRDSQWVVVGSEQVAEVYV